MSKQSQNERIDPARAFGIATMYHKAAERLLEAYIMDVKGSQADTGTLLPQMMLSAFAAELYMKVAYATENGGRKAPGRHDLKKLFDGLSEPFRDALRQQWKKDSHGLMVGFSRRDIQSPNLDFDVNLVLGRNAFEELRYAYEDSKMISFFLGNLPAVLHRLLLSLHPEWDASGGTAASTPSRA